KKPTQSSGAKVKAPAAEGSGRQAGNVLRTREAPTREATDHTGGGVQPFAGRSRGKGEKADGRSGEDPGHLGSGVRRTQWQAPAGRGGHARKAGLLGNKAHHEKQGPPDGGHFQTRPEERAEGDRR